MKKTIVLLFTLLISFNSYGNWTKIIKDGDKTYYIYFDDIKQKDGYVYWWLMASDSEDSSQLYLLSDCEMNRIKPMQEISYSQPLGKGGPDVEEIEDDSWVFLPPETVPNLLNSLVCQYVKVMDTNQKDYFLEQLKIMLEKRQ